MQTKQRAWHAAVFFPLQVDKLGGIRKSIADERRFVLSDGWKGPSQTDTLRRFWPERMLGVRWFVFPVFADQFCIPEELEHFGKLEVMPVLEVMLLGTMTLSWGAEIGRLFCVCCWFSSRVNLGWGSGPLALRNKAKFKKNFIIFKSICLLLKLHLPGGLYFRFPVFG